MKKFIGFLALLVVITQYAQENYSNIKSPAQFSSEIRCRRFHPDALAVVFFYASQPSDSCDQCALSHQCVAEPKKYFWFQTNQKIRKIFRMVSKAMPDILFLEVDAGSGCNQVLAKKYGFGLCVPEFVLFKNGQPLAVVNNRKQIDLCRPTESSLMHFVASNFSPYRQRVEVKQYVVEDVFEREPYQAPSLWDFGMPFYENALFPYAGPYYDVMVD